MCNQTSVGLELAGLMPACNNLGAASGRLQIPQKLKYTQHVSRLHHFERGEGRGDEVMSARNGTCSSTRWMQEKFQKPKSIQEESPLKRIELSQDLTLSTVESPNRDAVKRKAFAMSQIEVTQAQRFYPLISY